MGVFVCTPCNLINHCFFQAPGVEFNQKVGGTAFFHGSHDLAFTERYCGSNNDNTKVYPFLVRPSLTLGDA